MCAKMCRRWYSGIHTFDVNMAVLSAIEPLSREYKHGAISWIRTPQTQPYQPMYDPGSPSNSEAPPPAAAQSHSAQQLQQHPLWRVASGVERPMNPPPPRGRGRGRAAAQASVAPDNGARYERISLLAVELQQCATGGDGADSVLLSSDDEDGIQPFEKKRKAANSDEEEAYDYEEDDNGHADMLSVVCSEDGRFEDPKGSFRNVKASKKQKTMDPTDMMAAAAFGSGGTGHSVEDSDSASVVSRTSSKKKRDSYKQAFPVKGVTCVGCALANRIAPVERFINNNVGRMSENALWKMSALTWKLEVVEPAKQEGVYVMDWGWRDIANHFRLHTTNHVVGRTHMIQSLTAMRCQVEQRLVRVENGERELDKTNADLVLKILSAESRERSLLAASQSGGGRGRGGQKPAGED